MIQNNYSTQLFPLNWEYIGDIFTTEKYINNNQKNYKWLSDMTECNQIYFINNKIILQFSNDFNQMRCKYYDNFKHINYKKVFYVVFNENNILNLLNNDNYNDHKVPDIQLIDGSSRNYATCYMYDKYKQRHLLFNWLNEDLKNKSLIQSKYSGTLTIPRNITLNKYNLLCKKPIDEIKQLRDYNNCIKFSYLLSNNKKTLMFDNFHKITHNDNRCWDIEMKLKITTNTNNISNCGALYFGFYVNDNFDEYTILELNFNKNYMLLNRKNSSLLSDEYVSKCDEYIYFIKNSIHKNNKNEFLFDLRILLDSSVIEMFLNDGIISLSTRVYPKLNESVSFIKPYFVKNDKYQNILTNVEVHTLLYPMKKAK